MDKEGSQLYYLRARGMKIDMDDSIGESAATYSVLLQAIHSDLL